VPPDDPAFFADALAKAADNREEVVQMGNRAKLLAMKMFGRALLSQENPRICRGMCAREDA
jgi:glycosyltransferase involved in cell wall biosynthesis